MEFYAHVGSIRLQPSQGPSILNGLRVLNPVPDGFSNASPHVFARIGTFIKPAIKYGRFLHLTQRRSGVPAAGGR